MIVQRRSRWVAALQCCPCSYHATIWQVVSCTLHGSINCYHQNSCFDFKMQFTNHLSAGLRPDLLGEAYRTLPARPSSWVWDPSRRGRERNENGRRERGEKGDKAYGSGVEKNGKKKGRIEPWKGGREGTETKGRGGLNPKVGGNLRPMSTWNLGG